MRKDLAYLKNLILTTHPQPFTYISNQQFELAFQKAELEVEQKLTPLDFSAVLSELTGKLKDTHFRIIFNEAFQEYLKNGGYYLDINIKILSDKMFLVKGGENLIEKGSEILEINGNSSKEIIDRLSKLSLTEGNVSATRTRIVESFFKMFYPMVYPIDSLNNVKFRTFPSGSVKEIFLPSQKLDEATQKETHKKQNKKFPYELKFWNNGAIAQLIIRSFSEGRDKDFKKFIKKSFVTFQLRNTRALIIDLRNNGGGSQQRMNCLFSYIGGEEQILANTILKQSELSRRLFRKRFLYCGSLIAPIIERGTGEGQQTRGAIKTKIGELDTAYFNNPARYKKDLIFKGKTYVLANGLTGSASALFSAAIQQKGLGKVIGEECMTTVDGTFGMSLKDELPESKLPLVISIMRFNLNNDFKYSPEPFQPHFLVEEKIEDLVVDKDTQLEFALDLIRKK
ncbi:S41 family peptidase [Flexithrix dorotheae]|uniref:S41 family peptidase n=1 Tax=Flexithrix dorotheae TaxID=70993 RepID=UPI0012FA04A9|nr:S41 family peptidase [Flexithrix dorotheae]